MKKTILLAAVMFLALSVSAFAQSAFTVSQETLDRVACCGLAEPTGNIAFTAVADTPASITGTITLRYNLPIANTDAVVAAGPRRVQVLAVDGFTGFPLPAQPIAFTSNDGSNGLVVISVPGGYRYPTTITLSNVRVNVSGNCDTTTQAVTANAQSTGNLLTIGETTAITVVKGVAKPLKTPLVAIAPSGPTTVGIDASNGTVTGVATITINENFITAFGTTGVFPDVSRTQQTLIRLKVSPIPTGVTIKFLAGSGPWSTANSSGTPLAADVTLNANTSSQYVYYVMGAASNPAATDALVVSPIITTASPYPLIPTTISISAAMAPITSLTVASLFPQYTDFCETDAVAFATISGVLKTSLLVPYAAYEVGYNTALTVANTTLDPGTTVMGNFLQAIAQDGKLVIYFFPKDGSTIAPWVSTDTANLGRFGIDATGKLLRGRTFIALLSQLLPSSVTTFSGYLFVVTDFTNAHGEYFVSDFTNFTHGALMLVVNDVTRFAAGRTQEQGLNQ
jgi:hypothetical protein